MIKNIKKLYGSRILGFWCCEPSVFIKILSITSMIIGLAGIIVGIVNEPVIAGLGLLISIGFWQYSVSKGTGLHKEQTELIESANNPLLLNS